MTDTSHTDSYTAGGYTGPRGDESIARTYKKKKKKHNFCIQAQCGAKKSRKSPSSSYLHVKYSLNTK